MLLFLIAHLVSATSFQLTGIGVKFCFYPKEAGTEDRWIKTHRMMILFCAMSISIGLTWQSKIKTKFYIKTQEISYGITGRQEL